MMNRWIVALLLAASAWSFAGCGGSDQPRTDADGKVVKPPETPPNGV